MFRLDGRVALVTGAARGIGLAIARAFVAAGARVALADRDADEGARAAEGVGRFVALDVADPAAVAAAVARIVAEEGALDIVVNNAGAGARVASVDLPLADWQRVLDVNLTGAFVTAREAARAMIARGAGGAIVNIASIMGLGGNTLYPNAAYHATKGALVNLTRTLAVEWAPQRIRVNAVAPTFVRTALTQKLLAEPGMEAAILALTPLGRLAMPEEIAAAALYLCSDEAGLVTGQTLAVDGGWTAK